MLPRESHLNAQHAKNPAPTPNNLAPSNDDDDQDASYYDATEVTISYDGEAIELYYDVEDPRPICGITLEPVEDPVGVDNESNTYYYERAEFFRYIHHMQLHSNDPFRDPNSGYIIHTIHDASLLRTRLYPDSFNTTQFATLQEQIIAANQEQARRTAREREEQNEVQRVENAVMVWLQPNFARDFEYLTALAVMWCAARIASRFINGNDPNVAIPVIIMIGSVSYYTLIECGGSRKILNGMKNIISNIINGMLEEWDRTEMILNGDNIRVSTPEFCIALAKLVGALWVIPHYLVSEDNFLTINFPYVALSASIVIASKMPRCAAQIVKYTGACISVGIAALLQRIVGPAQPADTSVNVNAVNSSVVRIPMTSARNRHQHHGDNNTRHNNIGPDYRYVI